MKSQKEYVVRDLCNKRIVLGFIWATEENAQAKARELWGFDSHATPRVVGNWT